MSHYTLYIKYRNNTVFNQDYICRETMYYDFTDTFGKSIEEILISAQMYPLIFPIDYCDNLAKFLQNHILKSYKVISVTPNTIGIYLKKRQRPPHQAIISLVALFLRFYLLKFKSNSNLDFVIKTVLRSDENIWCMYSNPLGRISCCFYIWYLSNILKETPKISNDILTLAANGPNRYSESIINGLIFDGKIYSRNINKDLICIFINTYKKQLCSIFKEVFIKKYVDSFLYLTLEEMFDTNNTNNIPELDWEDHVR